MTALSYKPDDIDQAERDAHYLYLDATYIVSLPDNLFKIARTEALAAVNLILERDAKLNRKD